MAAAFFTFTDIAMAALLLYFSFAAMAKLTSKGPTQWPLLGLLPTLAANVGDAHEWATRALARAGGTFTYRGMAFGGCSGVVTAVPANLEHILKANFANYPKGAYYRERFAELLGGGIFNADGEPWRAQRRAAAAELHAARFAEFSFDAVAGLVRDKLLPFVAGADIVDLQDLLLRFTFDNICAVAFGVTAGCLDSPAAVPFARAFETATECSILRFIVPPFIWKPMRKMDVGSEKALRRAAAEVREFAAATVKARRSEKSLSGRADLLSRLMESGDYGDEFLTDFCISFILAGRDTTSVALAWFFFLLAAHPEVESRIVQEIMSVAGAASEKVSPAFTAAELRRMDYLHATLSEAMRLYPPVPIDFKEPLAADVLPDGTAVAAGQRIIYSIYSLGRSEAAWGADCREFRPERWLTSDGELAGEPSPFKFAVFNAGPRLCPGKKFAYMQMKCVAAALLARYRVVAAGEGLEVKPKLTTTLYMKDGFAVRFVPRRL